MPLVKAKCTSCGANLNVDNTKDAAICEFCGTPYIVEKAITHFISNNQYGVEDELQGYKKELISTGNFAYIYRQLEKFIISKSMNNNEYMLLLDILFYILPVYYSKNDYEKLWRKFLTINEINLEEELYCSPMDCDDAIEVCLCEEIDAEETCYFAFDCYKNILLTSQKIVDKDLIVKNYWEAHDRKHMDYISKINHKFLNNQSSDLINKFRDYYPEFVMRQINGDKSNDSIVELQNILSKNNIKLAYDMLKNYGQLKKKPGIINLFEAEISIEKVCSNKSILLHLNQDYNGYDSDFCDIEFEFYTTVIESINNIIKDIKESVEQKKRKLRKNNLCQHCGGKFKGIFNKVCSKCGKSKDY